MSNPVVPLQKVGNSCPNGYSPQGNMCVPLSSAKPAIHKIEIRVPVVGHHKVVTVLQLVLIQTRYSQSRKFLPKWLFTTRRVLC